MAVTWKKIAYEGDVVTKAAFTQDSGILVGTGVGTFAEETGATLRTSVGVYSMAEVDAAAIKWAIVFGG